jgi:hypothetical protein
MASSKRHEERILPGQPNAKLSEMAVASLAVGLAKAGQQTTPKGTRLLVNGRTLEPAVAIDYVRPMGTQFAVGTFVSSRIDGTPVPAIDSGSLGIDSNTDDAVRTAVFEWSAQFGFAMARALAGDAPAGVVSGFTVYAGLPGTKGERPPGAKLSETQTRLLAHLAPLVEGLSAAKGAMHAIALTIKVEPTHVQGECRLDGQVSRQVLDRMVTFDWPRSQTGYVFKQFYVLVPAR